MHVIVHYLNAMLLVDLILTHSHIACDAKSQQRYTRKGGSLRRRNNQNSGTNATGRERGINSNTNIVKGRKNKEDCRAHFFQRVEINIRT